MFSSYDESQDLLVFSNTFPFFFTTCSNPIDDDIAQEITNSNNDSIINSLDHSFSLSLANSPNLFIDQLAYLSVLDGYEVKSSEECQMGIVFDNTYNNNDEQYAPQSHNSTGDAESAAASEVVMQRSSSCNSFEGNSGSVPYEVAHHCENLMMDSPSFQWNATLSSLENSFFTGQLRRVFSAGDLQNTKSTHMFQRESRTLLEEANFNKVRRYSPEERMEKISKYRAKRSQRKFNKTIKYACRKTLADNRARIRGRFARNDDATVTIPKANNEDEFWIGLIEALDEEILR